MRKGNRPQDVGYGWHSLTMAKESGEVLYRSLTGELVRVTLVGTWRGAARLAKWRDLKYVGQVVLGACRRVTAC